MRKFISVLIAMSLVACSHKPETGLALGPRIPDLPANLAKKAGPLPPITDASMGGLVLEGTASDMKYNEVSHQLNNLIDVYNCVKISINEKKDIKDCLQ